ESELFGHVRGAFTGATQDKAGLFEAAHGGTLFLDEVGELSAPVQAKLLRTLENGEVQRVGAVEPRRVDVRVIAATNRSIEEEVAAGRFRSDLYYRLNVVEIGIPPLRDRVEDIPYLTAAFVRRYAREFGKGVSGLVPEAEERLQQWSWPGNVRELKNLVERLVVSAPGRLVRAEDLDLDARLSRACGAAAGRAAVGVPPPAPARATLQAVPSRDEHIVGQIVGELLEGGASFWDAVHAPFMSRDLSRAQLRAIIRVGLQRTSGNYRMLVQLFNMPADDYKRVLSFLRKHECQVPFQAFRGLGAPAAGLVHAASAPPVAYREAVGL
ncbi:MAG: sigma 54-interacting transcriptional regulator, partial [Vicinamibacterales bacterium]